MFLLYFVKSLFSIERGCTPRNVDTRVTPLLSIQFTVRSSTALSLSCIFSILPPLPSPSPVWESAGKFSPRNLSDRIVTKVAMPIPFNSMKILSDENQLSKTTFSSSQEELFGQVSKLCLNWLQYPVIQLLVVFFHSINQNRILNDSGNKVQRL